MCVCVCVCVFVCVCVCVCVSDRMGRLIGVREMTIVPERKREAKALHVFHFAQFHSISYINCSIYYSTVKNLFAPLQYTLLGAH